jgi:hypothetical protein
MKDLQDLTDLTTQLVNRVSSNVSGPVDTSFRAVSGCLKFTVRRHKFNQDSLSVEQEWLTRR